MDRDSFRGWEGMMRLRAALIGVGLAVVSLHSATTYKVAARYPVPGDGSFDYITLDSAARRLYISHGTQVDVVDADSGKVVGALPDTPGVHGIAIVPEFHRGFTSNGREDKVSIFDPASLKVINKIDVGKGPDGIYYEPATKRIFTNNHGSHNITAIDAKSGTVVGTVNVGGDGEQAIVGRDGMVYVNSEDTAEVVVFDPRSLEVKKRFPLGVAKVPTGLAYDAKTNRLFIGAREEPKMLVMDATSGKVVGTYPIGGRVDYAAFDPASQLIFLSCGDGTLNIFHEKSADEYEDAGAVKTQPSAATFAFDAKTKKIFMSAAEIAETPAADPSKRPTRTIKPGSFVVLVVAP
jgi:YVTN family beta-propeller protein